MGRLRSCASTKDRLRWVSERDGGQGTAINKGWHATHGEIFAYLNADDTYLPGALTAVAKHFRANPKAGLIYGEAYHVDVEGKTLDRYPTRPFSNDALAEQCIICQPAAFLAREAYVEAGMINSSMHFALDYDLWFRVAKKYPVRKVDEYLATSRMHMDNKTLANRRRVFQEILTAVKTHYGYVPQEWVHGYACYLLDRKDQFFDRSRPSVPSILLSLVLGAWYNPHQLRRYWAEWKRNAGVSQTFTGRWDDGWISRSFISEVAVGADHDVLRVSGRHNAPIRNLVLCVVVEGQRMEERTVSSNGPFLLEIPLPASVRGKACAVTVEANRTWRTGAGGDYRQLSCVIDELQTVSSRNAS
ncbi:MAG: glycosyltransferase [Acidobacteria bacterium]|nr:glycosyltransferase [Acidobacteriota bacterium]